MGDRGRIPASIETLKLHGRYRADRHAGRARGWHGSLSFDPAKHVPPLVAPLVGTGAGLTFWRETLPQLAALGVVQDSDIAAFGMLCNVVATMHACHSAIERDGLILTTSRGTRYEHPASKALHRLSLQFLQLSEKFGLSPASRKRLGIDVSAEPENKLDKYRVASRDRGVPKRDRGEGA